jgi:hypothetical protein
LSFFSFFFLAAVSSESAEFDPEALEQPEVAREDLEEADEEDSLRLSRLSLSLRGDERRGDRDRRGERERERRRGEREGERRRERELDPFRLRFLSLRLLDGEAERERERERERLLAGRFLS